jgi:hypothetical protein
MMIVDGGKLERFWQWFVQHEQLIRRAIEEESVEHQVTIKEQLDNLILDFGMLTWDLGLDENSEWFFTLSPNGDSDLLIVTEQIIEEAPTYLGWKFHASRPAKAWDRKFTIYDHEMEIQEIDASSWHYVAFLDSKNKIELILEVGDLPFEEEIIERAANLFLNNEIGERLLITDISTIQIVSELEPEDAAAKYSITGMKEHLGE